MVVGMFLLQAGGGLRSSIPALVAQSGPFAKAILIILVIMSVYSWAVIWNRMRLYSRVEKADRLFMGAFRRLPRSADFAARGWQLLVKGLRAVFLRPYARRTATN